MSEEIERQLERLVASVQFLVVAVEDTNTINREALAYIKDRDQRSEEYCKRRDLDEHHRAQETLAINRRFLAVQEHNSRPWSERVQETQQEDRSEASAKDQDDGQSVS